MKIETTCPVCNSNIELTANNKDIQLQLDNLFKLEKKEFGNQLASIASTLAEYYSLIEETKPQVSPYLDVEEQNSLAIVDRFYEWAFAIEKLSYTNYGTVLDVGSALTALPSLLAAIGHDVTSVDIQKWQMPWPKVKIYNLDLLHDKMPTTEVFDYVTCISAIEHFGLGRYGDTIDKDGDFNGIKIISDILKDKGTLILSVPVGKPVIVYPAHRIYGPKRIEKMIKGFNVKDKRFFNRREDVPRALFECSEEEAFRADSYMSTKPGYSIGCYQLIKEKNNF